MPFIRVVENCERAQFNEAQATQLEAAGFKQYNRWGWKLKGRPIYEIHAVLINARSGEPIARVLYNWRTVYGPTRLTGCIDYVHAAVGE